MTCTSEQIGCYKSGLCHLAQSNYCWFCCLQI